MTIILDGPAVGKPTMTQRDQWQTRACVLRYRAFCDRLRYKAWGKNQKQKLLTPTVLHVSSFFHTDHKRLHGQPQTHKPDASNILKAVEDALFSNDELIVHASSKKFWTMSKNCLIVEWEDA